jgi:hypothetical protein
MDLLEMNWGQDDADSMINRYNTSASGNGGQKIQKMLGIEDNGHPPLDKNPLSLMDTLRTIPLYEPMDNEEDVKGELDDAENEDDDEE